MKLLGTQMKQRNGQMKHSTAKVKQQSAEMKCPNASVKELSEQNKSPVSSSRISVQNSAILRLNPLAQPPKNYYAYAHQTA